MVPVVSPTANLSYAYLEHVNTVAPAAFSLRMPSRATSDVMV